MNLCLNYYFIFIIVTLWKALLEILMKILCSLLLVSVLIAYVKVPRDVYVRNIASHAQYTYQSHAITGSSVGCSGSLRRGSAKINIGEFEITL